MTRIDLKSLTDQQLYDRFVELSTKVGEVYSRTRLYNRYFDQRQELLAEIRSRRGDPTSLLLPALHHENPWVRYAATSQCAEGARDAALEVLRDLSRVRFHTLAPIAAMALDAYEDRLPSPEAEEHYRKMQARRERTE